MNSFDLGPVTITGDLLAVLLVAGVALLLLLLFTRRRPAGEGSEPRPLPAFALLQRQIGQAVENGSQIHVGLGRASLVDRRSSATIAGLQVLDSLAEESCANDTPPIITVGEGTILPAAQDKLYHAYARAERLRDFVPETVRFVADAGRPLVYAAGAADAVDNENVSANVLVGHFGAELALLTEAGARRQTEQSIGSDDPLALAIGAATTEHLLVGEEFLAAGAYLERRPNQLAALQVQDVLRLVLALTVVGAAAYQLLLGG